MEKKRKRRVAKATPSPQVDKMVRMEANDICICGRRMIEPRCQCGYVKPINKG